MLKQKTITVCSSIVFYDRIPEIERAMTSRGHRVLVSHAPDFRTLLKDPSENAYGDSLLDHFRKINQSDALYVANYDLNGAQGHIGGDMFLQIGKAFENGILIFLFQDLPNVGYREELLAMQPLVIGMNWELMRLFFHLKPQMDS